MSDVAEAAVLAAGLEKRYGPRTVLRDISFRLDAGGVLLVTGPNGAGKTTLLRMVGRARRADQGLAPRRGRSQGASGTSPTSRSSTSSSPRLENLDLFGRLYRVDERRERIGMLLERFGLWDVRHERVSAYSRGMTQRLALCRALLHDPALVVLDEPHSALDDEGAALLDDELAARVAGGGGTLVAGNARSRCE